MSEQPIARRTVLRRTGAAAIGGLGAAAAGTGNAAAELSPPGQAATESLVQKHADELFDTLAAEGILADPSALPTNKAASVGEVSSGGVGRSAMTDLDGVEEVRIGMQTDTGHLIVGIRPGRDEAYAVLNDGDTRQLIYPGEGPRPVQSDIEEGECGCTNINCGGLRTYVCNVENGGTLTECPC